LQLELASTNLIRSTTTANDVNRLVSYSRYIGDSLVYDPLIQNIRTAHSKEVEFRNKTFKVFRRELIFKQLSLENYANSLEAQLETQKAKSER
jgi:hypothetical protein